MLRGAMPACHRWTVTNASVDADGVGNVIKPVVCRCRARLKHQGSGDRGSDRFASHALALAS
jgi:hypothetical protein